MLVESQQTVVDIQTQVNALKEAQAKLLKGSMSLSEWNKYLTSVDVELDKLQLQLKHQIAFLSRQYDNLQAITETVKDLKC